MLFQFLRYLQPTHYFTLSRKNKGFIFPSLDEVPKSVLGFMQSDQNFKSNVAMQYDISWQLIQKGYINKGKGLQRIEPLPIEDEYRFIRKYFSPVWVFYVLMMRLLTLHNPIRETRCWLKTRNTKRYALHKDPIEDAQWSSFEGDLIKRTPLVSIIIPTLNRYHYLKDVLTDLEVQEYTNFEVIVVDQSDSYNAEFYNPFNLNIKVIHQKEKALWLARNTAIRESKGEYILFFDDDSRVDASWISNHLKCLDFFKAEVSSGVSISMSGAEVPKNYAYFRISDQLDTGNVMIKKSVFKKTGLFDRQFEKQRMGDGEFGMRVFINDFTNISNPYAKRIHLKVASGGLRDMGSWDAFRTKKWLAPRPIPSVLYFFRSYFGNRQAKWALLRLVPLSIMPYRFKRNKFLLVIGAIISILLLPLVGFQVYKSWKLATLKLQEGPQIDSLNDPK